MTPSQLREARSLKQVSQWKLAIATGVKRYRITMFECGYLDLDTNELDRIKEFVASVR